MGQERDYLADATRYDLVMAQQNKEQVRLKIPYAERNDTVKGDPDIRVKIPHIRELTPAENDELIQIIQDINKSYIGYFKSQKEVIDGYVIFYKELSVWVANSIVNRFISAAEDPYVLDSFNYDGGTEILYIHLVCAEKDEDDSD